ncbi:MAG: GntR family transcriptional regulator [bacterium]|jgi:DNA-binding GntR family transcriptional regulator|nr:GntR family transcriptional regulator [bacterium]MDD3804782.1 GntR family transcriptional regulator [bacterium]MDD4152111.1 GntR family transcriptional regulator [bacterium]MDD4557584.1 GntR family transcriptional regulator [bacterium]
MSFNLSQIEHANIDHRIYEIITEQILTGKLAPGARLTEEEIARQLGVSRTPVREAMKSLAKDELVELIPRKGMYVKKLELQDVVEIYDIRAVLEELAVTLATLRIPEAVIKEFRVRAGKSRQEIISGRNEESHAFDREFHYCIAEHSGNKRLAATIESLGNMVNFFRITVIARDDKQIRQALEEHIQIIEALEKRDATAAAEAMREHILHTRSNIMETLREEA